MTFEDKLDKSMRNLQRGIDKTFETMSGEILIDEPGSPERNDYPETDEGYRDYLYDCHEWALEGFREAVEEYQQWVAEIDAEAYPELGMHRKKDEQARKVLVESIDTIPEKFEAVLVWKEKVERIEQGFRNRDEDGKAPI